ncbi:MAG: gliding motility-associated C-terminal domain-containing protein [Croceivirga sp.]
MRSKTLKKILQTCCCLLVVQFTSAQILSKPTAAPNPNLGSADPWTAACASESFNEYFVNFKWSPSPSLVGSTNEFILELSDSNGDFGNATELARTGTENTNFDFDFQFAVPQNVQGDNYRFRVKSTNPALTSEASDAYALYYIGYDDPILISQDGNGNIPSGGLIQICDGESITLATHNVPDAQNYNYSWFRSGTKLSESSNQITIDKAGIYFVEVDYGTSCSGSANTLSNSIDISLGTSQGIAINTPSQTTLCPTDVVTLSTNISGAGYSYTWYKDGSVLAGPTVDDSSFDVDGSIIGFEGSYTVAISGAGICQEESSAIALASPGSFTVNRDNSDRMVLLPGQTEMLTISTDASSPTVQWYRNGSAITGANNLTLTINQIGEYYAAVTETGGSCGSSTKTSETTTVVQPNSFELTIAYDGTYADCANSNIILEVSKISALENGNAFDVTSQLQNDFAYQWMKDGAIVSGGTGATVSLASSSENGTYTLEANLDTFSMTSNGLGVVLNSGESITITDTGSQICDGVTIDLSTSYDLSGRTFSWTRNGQSIDTSSGQLTATEEGVYQLSVMTDGCPIKSIEVTLTRFDDSVIVVDAEENFIFPEGESQTVTATGGTSYEWYNAQNSLISSSSSVTLEQEGTYILVATIDNCQINRSFTVAYRDAFQIPNVITANGDGINDLWVIPNTYSRQSDVTVLIYNEVGEELLNQTAYANNWPPSSLGFSKKNQLFYYKIRKDNQTLKQGTITVIR